MADFEVEEAVIWLNRLGGAVGLPDSCGDECLAAAVWLPDSCGDECLAAVVWLPDSCGDECLAAGLLTGLMLADGFCC